MIQLLRVDHRLLHGQVAVSWVQGLGSNCIFCVGDKVANDPVWKTTLKMGKPAGCKLVIKDMEHAIEAINSGVTDKYKMIICVATIAEAKQLVEGCPQIKSVNLGNTKPKDEKRPDARQVSRQIFLTRPRKPMCARCWIVALRSRFDLWPMTPRLTAPACSRRSISKSLRVLRSVLYGKGDVCLPKQSSSDLSPHLVSSTASSVRSMRSAPSSCARSWVWCWGTCSPASRSVRAWSCCSWARSPSALRAA